MMEAIIVMHIRPLAEVWPVIHHNGNQTEPIGLIFLATIWLSRFTLPMLVVLPAAIAAAARVQHLVAAAHPAVVQALSVVVLAVVALVAVALVVVVLQVALALGVQ